LTALLRLLMAALLICPLAARAQAPAAPQDSPPLVQDYIPGVKKP
jgi:hypothetical protein